MLDECLKKAKAAQVHLARASSSERNAVLSRMEQLLSHRQAEILEANREDLAAARADLDAPRTVRLALSLASLSGLQQGLTTVRQLPDPLGRGHRWTLPNGLVLEQVRVPLGVIGLIYESRPGVSVEAPGLALKSGNSILLRGGREAQRSNAVLVELWRQALAEVGLPQDTVQLLSDPDRTLARQMMHLTGLDLLIPRGGPALIQTVVSQATVPIVQTGVGNCHLYIDRAADIPMALNILEDGKIGNPAVCNALETVLIHKDVHEVVIPAAFERLARHGVVWHGDRAVQALLPDAVPATEDDWSEEYLGLHLAARVVDSLDDALHHISRYGTGHSESIVTSDYPTGQEFLAAVDAAVVYWNASTRFSDGHQFGFGAEVGISTQKLHARGPMGLDALTTMKTLALGSGQTRDL